ncbi:hypothetical protein [Cognatishimia maritima]|uniref:MetA-pathway of phenol degradation n=1 Tax=Cognatishimia maritima TaxID=870908 RepID=A0A1M5KKC3_9RHOB|nr:hypothetical protein [Cognatishimia maritima]SHG53247.1 hypothetical protein SAMN04488044_1001 [Cognatishimia maritima]
MRTIWIIMFLLVPMSALPGPWLRPDGEGFMSVDSIGSVGRNQGDLWLYNGLFLEYGLSDRTTIGLTGGMDHLGDGSVTTYLRRALPINRAGWIASGDLGIGTSFSLDQTTSQPSEPHLRLGVSIGRGGLWGNPGTWFALDSYALFEKRDKPMVKAEATLGHRTDSNWLWMVQLIAEIHQDDDPITTFAPSVAIPLKRKSHLQIGAMLSDEGEGRFGLKAALWRSF